MANRLFCFGRGIDTNGVTRWMQIGLWRLPEDATQTWWLEMVIHWTRQRDA